MLWMLGTIFGTLSIKNSYKFKKILKVVENDERVLEKTGRIKYYGFWAGESTISKKKTMSDFTNLSIVAIGEKNTVRITITYNVFKEENEITDIKTSLSK